MVDDKKLRVTAERASGSVVEIRLHPSVLRQAQRMQSKLDERLERYPEQREGEDHWLTCRVDHLIAHAQKEMAEFVKAAFDNLFDGEDVGREEAFDHLKKEGADVCNLVMMVVDRTAKMRGDGFGRLPIAEDGDREYIKG